MSYNYEARQVLKSLGIKDDRLPTEGTPDALHTCNISLHGTKHQVVMVVRVLRKTKIGRGHRLMADCPQCGKSVSFGRIYQHMMVHK